MSSHLLGADLRVVGIALVALSVAWPHRRVLQFGLATLGGVVLVRACWHASFQGRSNGWAIPLVIASAAALGWAVPIVREAMASPAAGWLLLAGCSAAVYACVPETDQLGEVWLLLACGIVVELVTRRRMPAPVLAAASALVLWAAVFGATGRRRALVGGLFALVPVAATATIMARRPVDRAAVGEPWRWAVAAVWVAAAVVVARTGGIARTLAPAVLSVAVAAPLAAVISAALWRRAGRSPSAE